MRRNIFDVLFINDSKYSTRENDWDDFDTSCPSSFSILISLSGIGLSGGSASLSGAGGWTNHRRGQGPLEGLWMMVA